MSVSYECCVFVRWKSLRRADPSSRGVLPTVVCHCVWYRKPQMRRQAETHSGLWRQQNNNNNTQYYKYYIPLTCLITCWVY
jgi:hypothetical protein